MMGIIGAATPGTKHRKAVRRDVSAAANRQASLEMQSNSLVTTKTMFMNFV